MGDKEDIVSASLGTSQHKTYIARAMHGCILWLLTSPFSGRVVLTDRERRRTWLGIGDTVMGPIKTTVVLLLISRSLVYNPARRSSGRTNL